MSDLIELQGEKYDVLITKVVYDDYEAPGHEQVSVSIWERDTDPEEPSAYSLQLVNADRLAFLLRSNGKAGLLGRLRDFRKELEAALTEDGGEGLSLEQAIMFMDMCRALGLIDAELKYVLGEAFDALVDARLFYPVFEVPAEILRRALDSEEV